MTKPEFEAAFRGKMLVFLAEAWAARKESPTSLGLLMDDHHRKIRGLLGEMYDALQPPPPAPTAPERRVAAAKVANGNGTH